MRIDYLSSDILLFRGDSLAALATAFIDGSRVLLVDLPASDYDTLEMRSYLEGDLGLTIDSVLLSGTGRAQQLHLLPKAQLLTARQFSLEWGRHHLQVVDTGGDSGGALAIDVPTSDMLLVAERIVGHIARLGENPPEQLDAALAVLHQRGRARVVPAYGGAQHGVALANACHYLSRLGQRVGQVRIRYPGTAGAAIGAIALDECLAEGVHASPLERHWHMDNLKQIVERGWYAQAPAQPGSITRNRVMSSLTGMLGRLARTGV